MWTEPNGRSALPSEGDYIIIEVSALISPDYTINVSLTFQKSSGSAPQPYSGEFDTLSKLSKIFMNWQWR
jgi:hypothetical protein